MWKNLCHYFHHSRTLLVDKVVFLSKLFFFFFFFFCKYSLPTISYVFEGTITWHILFNLFNFIIQHVFRTTDIFCFSFEVLLFQHWCETSPVRKKIVNGGEDWIFRWLKWDFLCWWISSTWRGTVRHIYNKHDTIKEAWILKALVFQTQQSRNLVFLLARTLGWHSYRSRVWPQYRQGKFSKKNFRPAPFIVQPKPLANRKKSRNLHLRVLFCLD